MLVTMTRVKRIYHHFCGWAYDDKSKAMLPPAGILPWFVDLFFLTTDLLFVGELFSVFRTLVGKGGRPLTNLELSLLTPIFRDSVNYDSVRLYADMPKFIGRWAHAFVLFNTINYKTKISDDVLVHEMVHVWQYQRFGSAYIGRALMAQCSKDGYNYGGVEKLFAGMTAGKALIEFNFEQQGDIIQDGYLQSKGIRGINNHMYSAVYLYYSNQLSD